jgi:3-oxoacyl-[acyl-carrier protein] reductase
MLLENRVAVVTGGGSGIGEAICKLFAKEGCKVAVADYNWDAAKRVSDEINEMFSAPIPMQINNESAELWHRDFRAIPVHVNVADRKHVDNMIWDVIHMFGRIDILANNAGITRDKTLVKMTQEQWDEVIAVNQTGVFNCASACIPYMIEQGFGRIINTSSIVGLYGNVGQTQYSAAKAAVIAMAKTWAKEYGRKGITANCVAPGFIRTPMTAKMPPEVLTNMESMVPLKRLGEAEDIANAFLFLVSDMGKYINGAVIDVNGGLSI